MNNKEKYIQFCTEHPDIPVFSQSWWLDAVCPNQWDVILIERNNEIIASFPYYKTKTKEIFSHIGMPPLTHKLGPFIIYDENNKTSENKKLGYEQDIYNEIINKLPKCDSLSINFDWKYKNWLPFYWRGFKQATKYTYIINNMSNHDFLIDNYTTNKKQPLQKVKDKFTIQFDLSKDIFYSYLLNDIEERSDLIGFTKELFYSLYDAMNKHNCGRTLYCTDSDNNVHAVNMVVWDKECAYYLLSTKNKKFNTSDGLDFLVYETIKYVSQSLDNLDFEESMIKGFEEFYRHFGLHKNEYNNIFKFNNPLLKTLNTIIK
jgi:hypothetical protein